MANPTITNGVLTATFIVLNNTVVPVGLEVVNITRPGIDGHAVLDIGTRGQAFTLLGATDAENAADALGELDVYKELQGGIVTVTDAHGVAHANILVEAVMPYPPATKVTTVAGAVRTVAPKTATYVLFSVWQLRSMQ